MNRPDGIVMAARVLGLYDGGEPAPAMVRTCDQLGMDLLPYVECMPFGAMPRMLVAPISQWRLALGLSADFSGFVEVAAGRPETVPAVWQDCIAAVRAGGIGVSLTSASAYSHDVPCPFMTAIGRRFATPDCLPAMELALYEALANAIIHGNLGIDSALRGSASGLREYRAALAHALADPCKAARRVTVTCQPHGAMLRLVVHDQGAGWDVGALLTATATMDAKSGRGLDLIRQVATAVTAQDDGRRLVMDFCRHTAVQLPT